MNKIFVALLTIFLAQTSVQATDKIRISTPGDAAHFTMHLAQKRGFLKEEGFEAEIITISGPVANIALSNGDTDYFSGFGSALRSIVQGLPLRIVSCYRPTPHFMLQSRPRLWPPNPRMASAMIASVPARSARQLTAAPGTQRGPATRPPSPAPPRCAGAGCTWRCAHPARANPS